MSPPPPLAGFRADPDPYVDLRVMLLQNAANSVACCWHIAWLLLLGCVSSTSPSRFAQIPTHVNDLRVIVLRNAVNIVVHDFFAASMLLDCVCCFYTFYVIGILICCAQMFIWALGPLHVSIMSNIPNQNWLFN